MVYKKMFIMRIYNNKNNENLRKLIIFSMLIILFCFQFMLLNLYNFLLFHVIKPLILVIRATSIAIRGTSLVIRATSLGIRATCIVIRRTSLVTIYSGIPCN